MRGARLKGSSLIPINPSTKLGRLWVAGHKERYTSSIETCKECDDKVIAGSNESHNCWVPHPESGMFVPPGALAVKGGAGNVTIRHDPSISKVWVRSTETMEDKDYTILDL